MLYQFQCLTEGTLFYYQHESRSAAHLLVQFCPLCASSRVRLTGRSYPEITEQAPLPPEEKENEGKE